MIFYHSNPIVNFALNVLCRWSNSFQEEIEQQKEVLKELDSSTKKLDCCDKINRLLQQRTAFLFSYLQTENPTLPELQDLKNRLTSVTNDLRTLAEQASLKLVLTDVQHDEFMKEIDNKIRARDKTEELLRAAEQQTKEPPTKTQPVPDLQQPQSIKEQKAGWLERTRNLHLRSREVRYGGDWGRENLIASTKLEIELKKLQSELLVAKKALRDDKNLDAALQTVTSDLLALEDRITPSLARNPLYKQEAERIRNKAADEAKGGI